MPTGHEGLPAPGSGAGRPCYINHESAGMPVAECDGLHGDDAVFFSQLESMMVTSSVYRRIYAPAEDPTKPTCKPAGRYIRRRLRRLFSRRKP